MGFDRDWFNPEPIPAHHITPPATHQPFTPSNKPLPEQDRLFAVQDDLLDALDALSSLRLDKSHTARVLENRLDSAYRTINTYLREHTNQGGVMG